MPNIHTHARQVLAAGTLLSLLAVLVTVLPSSGKRGLAAELGAFGRTAHFLDGADIRQEIAPGEDAVFRCRGEGTFTASAEKAEITGYGFNGTELPRFFATGTMELNGDLFTVRSGTEVRLERNRYYVMISRNAPFVVDCAEGIHDAAVPNMATEGEQEPAGSGGTPATVTENPDTGNPAPVDAESTVTGGKPHNADPAETAKPERTEAPTAVPQRQVQAEPQQQAPPVHGVPTNDAVVTSSVFPKSIPAGASFAASFTVKNTGNITWAPGGTYPFRFVTANLPGTQHFWGVTVTELPRSVKPGESVTFTLALKAPATTGSYPFLWRMLQGTLNSQSGPGFFGPETGGYVEVTKSSITDDAALTLELTDPDRKIFPGDTFPLKLTVKNIGGTTWTPQQFFVRGRPVLTDRMLIPLQKSVAPGEEAVFEIPVRAPAAVTFERPLAYASARTGFELVKKVTDTVTQDRTLGIAELWVTVSDPAVVSPNNGAAVLAESLVRNGQFVYDKRLEAGQEFTYSVFLRNTGAKPWKPDTHRLRFQDTENPDRWGAATVALPLIPTASIPPGQTVTLTLKLRTPQANGTFPFRWRMEENGEAFGGTAGTELTVWGAQPQSPPEPVLADNAVVTAVGVKNAIAAGGEFRVTFVIQNTGTDSWDASAYRLVPADMSAPGQWGVIELRLPDGRLVEPGQTVWLTRTFKAPPAEGMFPFLWQMSRDGAPFGNVSGKESVRVLP